MLIHDPAALQVRRLSAEEFCTLARREANSFYRPYSELLRMLAVAESYALCAGAQPQTALLALPLNANVEAAAALRQLWGGWLRGGCLLTPPVGEKEGLLPLLQMAQAGALRRRQTVWAALACTAEAELLLPLYLQAGLALRALRPLQGLAPFFLLGSLPHPPQGEGVWLSLRSPVVLARLLCRGCAAVEARRADDDLQLRVVTL